MILSDAKIYIDSGIRTFSIKDVKEFTKEHGSGLYAGKEVRFPVADGYARYMVLSLRPVELIHLDIEDGWNFQYVERLTAADIKEKLRSQKGLKKLFQN